MKAFPKRYQKSDGLQVYLCWVGARRHESFLTMYIMRGVNGVEMGQNNDFLEKSGLNTAFLSVTNLDQLTLGGSETHIFEGIANFSMCFKRFGALSSK